MKNNIEFTRDLIKGKIAEIIFEQMFREGGRFTILRSGYEYVYPELAQYYQLPYVEEYIEKIRHFPDFILISEDKKEAYVIEVKYRSDISPEEIRKTTSKCKEIQNPSWLFVASPKGFFCGPCNTILENNGKMGRLCVNPGENVKIWIEKIIQDKYLKLLKEIEIFTVKQAFPKKPRH